MNKLTDIERNELKKEFTELGLLVEDYHKKVRESSNQYDFDKANYYLEEARKCLVRRNEILETLCGRGIGLAY